MQYIQANIISNVEKTGKGKIFDVNTRCAGCKYHYFLGETHHIINATLKYDVALK